MNEGKLWGRMRAAIAGVVVVVLFQPMVGVLTDTRQGVAYGQAREQELERYNSAECVKLRTDLKHASHQLAQNRQVLDRAEEHVMTLYLEALSHLVQITNLREQIAGLDAAEVFLPTGETKVRGLLQEMRKKAEARLKEQTYQYASSRDELNRMLPLLESYEAHVKDSERSVAYVQGNLSAAGCDLPPGAVISSLPPPSVLGAPLPPRRPPTTQVPGIVAPRVPPKPPAPGAMRLEFVKVTSDPAQPYGDWTWGPEGLWIDQRHIYSPGVGYSARYEWTEPAIGPEGLSTTLTLTVTPAPKNDLFAAIGVSGGFDADLPGLEVQAKNGQTATRSVTVTAKLPKSYSGDDIYLRIGAAYGPSFVYHYRVVR